MLELMDRSPRVNRFIWFLTFSGLFIVILWKLPKIADFWLKVRG